MKRPASAHTSQSWLIHEIAPDFRLEDVWSLPTPGGPNDFPRLVTIIATDDDTLISGVISRLLFAVRMTLGALLRLDRTEAGVGSRVTSLRERVPSDLIQSPTVPPDAWAPFHLIYQTEREVAIELANATVHAVMHVGWVPDDNDDGFRGQLAVLVKPNGVLGNAYMKLIDPFREKLVYPAMMRGIARTWSAVSATRQPMQEGVA